MAFECGKFGFKKAHSSLRAGKERISTSIACFAAFLGKVEQFGGVDKELFCSFRGCVMHFGLFLWEVLF